VVPDRYSLIRRGAPSLNSGPLDFRAADLPYRP
jgi:hypothetical protein